jgi:TonB family protein
MKKNNTKMKYIPILLCALMSFTFCGAQDSSKAVKPASTVFTIVEVMPQFPGGEAEMLKFIQANIRYPKDAKEKKIQGRVYVNFVVDATGKITDARVIRGIGGGCDEEALRVVNLMPTWKPGTQDGKAVRVAYNLPFNFSL